MPRGLSSALSCRVIIGLNPIDAQRQRLHDQPLAVAIHDQPRQSVGFGVDQAARFVIAHHAPRNSSRQATRPEVFIHGFVGLPRQQPHGDLRTPIEITARQEFTLRREHIDDFTIRLAASMRSIAPEKIHGCFWRTGLSRLGLRMILFGMGQGLWHA